MASLLGRAQSVSVLARLLPAGEADGARRRSGCGASRNAVVSAWRPSATTAALPEVLDPCWAPWPTPWTPCWAPWPSPSTPCCAPWPSPWTPCWAPWPAPWIPCWAPWPRPSTPCWAPCPAPGRPARPRPSHPLPGAAADVSERALAPFPALFTASPVSVSRSWAPPPTSPSASPTLFSNSGLRSNVVSTRARIDVTLCRRASSSACVSTPLISSSTLPSRTPAPTLSSTKRPASASTARCAVRWSSSNLISSTLTTGAST